MPKITEEEATTECKELWEAIEKSGLSKDAFLDSKEGRAYEKVRHYAGDCPLCQYAGSSSCTACPLVVKYGTTCSKLGYNTASSKATKKFFAAVKGL